MEQNTPQTPPGAATPDSAAEACYRQVLEALSRAGVPFLVGGTYAFADHTGIRRQTKDLDLFIREADFARCAQVLAAAGHETERTFPHWLGKVHAGPTCVDLVYNSGNGIARVDDVWFEHGRDAEILGVPVKLVPVEEMIWSKVFVMERERYDGADVAHLMHAHADVLDWARLLERIGPHWRVLLNHLILFGFVYPDDRDRVPRWLMERLMERLHDEMRAPLPAEGICRGTLLSREQYLHDVERRGYGDGREQPNGSMSTEDIAIWTEAIPGRRAGPPGYCGTRP
ncbi:nucleotidyltransferase [Caldimonas tepidiphila]|uniref:nucleotidyltransferase n=1 Tax=Caldimonas tepidiphila TaxID=2315841 RepID=UPI000E5B2D3A|nr:nucleotidyltransferase [Caldimonas tepidiphila]